MHKKISIIVPAWNAEKYIAEALNSILNQSYQNREIIVVNDGSVDQTQHIIERFGNQILSVSQENKGVGAARNTGIKMASGEYIAFLDADDLWDKNKLTKQMEIIESHKENDPLVFSLAKQFICPSLNARERDKIKLNNEVIPGYSTGTLLLSRKRMEDIGYFVHGQKTGEFIDWYARALHFQVQMIMLDEILLFRRIHINNMGRQRDLYDRKDYLKILKANLDHQRQCYRDLNNDA